MLTFKPATECPDEALPTPVPGRLPSLSLCLSFSSGARPWPASAPLWPALLWQRNASVHLVYGRSLVRGSAAACNVRVCVYVCVFVCVRVSVLQLTTAQCQNHGSAMCGNITAQRNVRPVAMAPPHSFLASPCPMRPPRHPLHPPNQSHTSTARIHATPTHQPSSVTHCLKNKTDKDLRKYRQLTGQGLWRCRCRPSIAARPGDMYPWAPPMYAGVHLVLLVRATRRAHIQMHTHIQTDRLDTHTYTHTHTHTNHPHSHINTSLRLSISKKERPG